MPSQRWWAPLAKVGLLLTTLLLALLVGEGGFRLISRERVELHGMYGPDPDAGVGLSPGFRGRMRTSEFDYRVSINELGMRDHAVGPRRPGVARVLVLGDSFVFGVGVDLEDSLPKALERRLESDPSSAAEQVEVFNGGVPGYSPFQALQTLRRLAPVIEPDLVVLVFFVGDDWFGNAPRVPPDEARRSLRERLRIHSALFRAFDRFVLSRLKGREEYEIHRLVPTAGFQAREREVLRLLEEIRRTAADHGAPLLIALCPRYTQVYDGAWSKAALVYRLGSAEYSPEEPNRGFGEILAAGGFRYVDLLDPLRSEGRHRQLHFPIDGHWNRDGIDFVASILAPMIRPRLARPLDSQDDAGRVAAGPAR